MNKPSNDAQLRTRMAELSEGCSALIAADHKQLPAGRDLLKQKCKEWQVQLNGFRTELESGRADYQQTLDNVDKLVNRVAGKLQVGFKA